MSLHRRETSTAAVMTIAKTLPDSTPGSKSLLMSSCAAMKRERKIILGKAGIAVVR
jgi:hypothetical protein